MSRRILLLILAVQSILVATLAFAGCLGKTGDTGGETHWAQGWLSGCVSDAGCNTGLSCIANLCTIGCTLDTDCSDVGGACIDVGLGGNVRACAVPERIGCSADANPCTTEIDGWLCITGGKVGCSTSAVLCDAGQWVPGTVDDCRDTITRTAPTASPSPRSETFETVIGDADVALDIVFVVDNSSSMTDEQRSVAIGFDGFLQTLSEKVAALPRIAVTNPDLQCAVSSTISTAKGTFNQVATTAYPASSQFNFRAECLDDAECEAAACDALGMCAGQEGLWSCRTPASATCSVNPNGSINSTCRRKCTTDTECQTAFDDPTYICQMPSQSEADWGCLRPPPTAECPDTLPLFAEGDDLGLAHCLISVGVNQENCFKFEQGLEASLKALDANGPNADQVAAFLRPEAILVVIYLSDEDDCSITDTSVILEDSYETCALLKTTDDNGPLYPTSRYVDFLRNLKPQGRVMAISMTGASTKLTPQDIQADYDSYLASKGDPKSCYHQTSLCQTPLTVADWGKRYIEVADAFGPDGYVANLCTIEDDYSEQFKNVAAKIAQNAKRICLPRADNTDLVVSIEHAGSKTILTAGGTSDTSYTLIEGAAECTTGLAVAPARRLVSGDRVRLTYP